MRNPTGVQVSRIPDDAELARRARAGSLDALAALYERHAGAVYAVAVRLLASPADAEDVVQDVFVGLPTALQRYEERGTFGGWLRRVATRHALMVHRAGRRLAPPDVEGAVAADPRGAGVPSADPVRRIAARDAIAALPDSLRIVFVLKEVEGHSHDEIGTLLGISARASALRLHRAWKQLRRREATP